MRASSVLAQTALPRHLKKRQVKKIEALAEIAAHDLDRQDTAEYLVGILDSYEQDPDLEPSLGSCTGCQTRWAASAKDDLEDQSEDEGAQQDCEHDLGWNNPWPGPWNGASGDGMGHEGGGGADVYVDARPELQRLRSLLSRKGARS